LDFKLIFNVVSLADFKVYFTPVIKSTFNVPGVPDIFKVVSLIIFYIIDEEILLPD